MLRCASELLTSRTHCTQVLLDEFLTTTTRFSFVDQLFQITFAAAAYFDYRTYNIHVYMCVLAGSVTKWKLVRLQVLVDDVWQEISQDSTKDNGEIQRGSTPWERSHSWHRGAATLAVCVDVASFTYLQLWRPVSVSSWLRWRHCWPGVCPPCRNMLQWSS